MIQNKKTENNQKQGYHIYPIEIGVSFQLIANGKYNKMNVISWDMDMEKLYRIGISYLQAAELTSP